MANNKLIQFRCTSNQKERIINRMHSLGYVSISSFLRDLALKDDLASFKLIREIHEKVVLKNKNPLKTP